MRRLISSVLREPLVQLIVLGALLFGLNAWLGGPAGNARPVIQVYASDVDRFRELFGLRWGRPPTGMELRGLVNQYVREEILYREAVALGLDQDDTIVRRRLAQKMEFVSQGVDSGEEPSEEELARFFERNAARYREPARVTFTHIYFSRDRRGAAADRDAKSALTALMDRPEPPLRAPQLGDPFMLQYDYAQRSEQEIADLFGSDFAAAVMGLSTGSWQGPVASSYGLHLVRVSEHLPARQPTLKEVRKTVLADFEEARRKEKIEAFYARLRKRYRVVVDEKALEEAPSSAVAEVRQ